MTRTLICLVAAACVVAASASPAPAQEASTPKVLDRIFGARERVAPDAAHPVAQGDAGELIVRIDRLEAQIRQLTGTIEQLQFRNQQLETQIRQMEAAAPPAPGATPARPQPQPPGVTQARPQPPVAPSASAPPPAPTGRRSDVFDPKQNPGAPGAPRPLGTLPAPQAELPQEAAPPIGVPDGRAPGAPLDLSTLATRIPGAAAAPGSPPPAGTPSTLPAPPPRTLSATGTAVAPPSETAQGYFDLAYGYVLRKDYAFAEEAFKTFLNKYPEDQLVADAQFWLGESLFQRQRYDGAAEHFLVAATKHPGYAKAADALLRLAQSLAAINQKEMACATLAEVVRKYPRASNSIRQGVEREQKRVRC